MTGTLRVLLPLHWVGSLPKRQLPVVVKAEVYRAESCASCSHRAVDDTRKVYRENGQNFMALTEEVYCSLHGWGFPTVADEQKHYCLDHPTQRPKDGDEPRSPVERRS